MRLEEVFLNDLAQSNLVGVDRPPMRIDITGVGQPTPPEDVGPAPDDVATQMVAGTEPEGATPMTLGEFATTVADAPAGVLKGVVQGTVGLPGDIISLVRGVYDLGASGGSLDAFLAGLEKPTGLPTTEDVKTFFDKTLGIPLVPEGASDRRMEAVKTAEFVGELGGAGKTAIAGTRAAVRGARDIVQEMATTPPRGSVQIRPTPVQTPTPVQAPRVAPQAIEPLRVEGGIRFPEGDVANRLRLKLQREQQAAEGKAMPGMPKNDRTVIEAPEGSRLPNFVIGKIEPEDWIERTESMLSPEEIRRYAKWYDDVRGTFLKYTNNDDELTDKYMRAWLVANQNIGVDGAFNNVLLQAEQFARNVPRAEMRAGGLPFATRAARNALQNEPIVEGVGLKISDFVDSAENKSVRSIYGNDERAGQPFVVDIHTARDTGLVDEILLNHLENRGYTVNRDSVKIDFMGGPTDTQYENRSDFGRALTARLNEISWQGKSDWQPKEVQAIGWMSMTKLTADAADDTVTALERNLRRISAEAAPGEGSPWAARFGKRFAALTPEKQAALSTAVVERAMQMAKDVSGIDLRGVVHGTGGWQMFQNPASVGQALATREGAEIAANTLGYLLQQTEVWVNSVKGMTKNPKALAVDFIEEATDNLSTDDGLRNFWQKVMEADPTGLFVGYQPIRTVDGKVGIRVLIDKGGEKRVGAVQSAIQGPISDMVKSMDFEMSVSGYEADLVKARNDWKGMPDGRTYLERLANLGVRRTAADFDPLRRELEDIFEQGLGGSATADAASTKLKRTAKAKIAEGQKGPKKGVK
jgi:hypothetical protein